MSLSCVGGRKAEGFDGAVFCMHNDQLKFLHIPKMMVPTGMDEEGRPTGVQLWGRAATYEQMFNDAHSAERDVDFLHLMDRVSDAIAASPALRRADAGNFSPLISPVSSLPR